MMGSTGAQWRNRVCGVALVLALSACGDLERGSAASLIGPNLRASSASNETPDPRSVITPEAVAAVGKPVAFIDVRGPKVSSSSAIVQILPGDPARWESPDKSLAFILQGGLPVRSHGLVFDLAGADVSATLAALRSGTPQHLRREMRDLDGENHEIVRAFDCSFAPEGTETLHILGTPRKTTRYREACSNGDLTFENRYWRGADDILWKSHTWLSDGAGMITIERLSIGSVR